jgi:hypothetical protein
MNFVYHSLLVSALCIDGTILVTKSLQFKWLGGNEKLTASTVQEGFLL